jgi:hypothetical protein
MVSAILNGGLSHLFSIYSNGCAFGIPRLHLFSGAIIVPETSTNRPLIFPLVPVALAFVLNDFLAFGIWLKLVAQVALSNRAPKARKDHY